MAQIEFHELTKRYGQVIAVDRLTLSPRPGRITGFVGANGAGKTTTIRMLLGLTRPSSGTATIDGRPYAELRDPLRSIGAMVDPNVFHPRRTGRNAGLTNAARRRAGGYSTGMRQRLALAAALLGDPDTLVLDEPANGLDPEGVHWLRGLIKSLAADGRTVFVSSHLLAELAQTIDDVVIIAQGRLITHEPVSGLLARADSASLEDVYLELTQSLTDNRIKETS